MEKMRSCNVDHFMKWLKWRYHFGTAFGPSFLFFFESSVFWSILGVNEFEPANHRRPHGTDSSTLLALFLKKHLPNPCMDYVSDHVDLYTLVFHNLPNKYLLRRRFIHVFGVQIPPHKVFGSLLIYTGKYTYMHVLYIYIVIVSDLSYQRSNWT